MAIFENNPEEWQRLDWTILQSGWASLYWKTEILEDDILWFETEKYEIVDFDCSQWNGENGMHLHLKKKLSFPSYYGENWDALSDCLSEMEINDVGQIVVLRHLDFLEISQAHKLLDILARNARIHMLFGERLIVLAQVDNPNYQIKDIGSTTVRWNGAEWLDSKRQ